MPSPNRTGLFDNRQELDFPQLFKIFAQMLRMSIHTCAPGKLVATQQQPNGYDPATQKASIEIQFRRVEKDLQSETGVIVRNAQVVPNIPVAFPRTQQGYLTFPLNIGDTGTVIFSDRVLNSWLQSSDAINQTGKAIDPILNREHDYTDGIFMPGLHTDGNSISPSTDQTATVLHDDLLIKIGRQAEQFAIKGEDAYNAFTTLINNYNNHTHNVGGIEPGGGNTTSATPSPQNPTLPITVLSTKTQIE